MRLGFGVEAQLMPSELRRLGAAGPERSRLTWCAPAGVKGWRVSDSGCVYLERSAEPREPQ